MIQKEPIAAAAAAALAARQAHRLVEHSCWSQWWLSHQLEVGAAVLQQPAIPHAAVYVGAALWKTL